MEMLETQPVEYARLQLVWLSVGILAMMVVIYFGYELYGHYANTFYVLNIVLLVVVLGMEAGRGGMTAFFTWGSGSERTFQPSEVGKIAMIIAFAKAFSVRLKPVMNVRDLLPLIVYMGIPLLLIIAQPDVGTALVYLAVFCVMVFVSGTNYKLILGVLACAVVLIIPVWTFMNATDSFRLMRILIWLDPESYPDEARQVINAGIAVGRGGLWGQGIVSPGSYASLGYISDDHTDFIFAVCCESFGMVGACVLVLLYMLLLGPPVLSGPARAGPLRLLPDHRRGLDAFVPHRGKHLHGHWSSAGHGHPPALYELRRLHMITNMMGIGLVMNVVMRSRSREHKNRLITSREVRL